MKKGWLLLCFLLSGTMYSSAQSIPESEIILFKKQRYGGFNINTNGYGGFATFGKYKGAYKLRLLSVDFLIVKHEKEVRSYGPDPTGRAYFYGKQNNFYTLRTGIGRKVIVTEKLRRSGVQVGYSWLAGPVFGITKPVYLEILYASDSNLSQAYIKVERFDSDRHFPDIIYGRASGLRGFSELKLYPGLFAKFAMSFEYSNEKERLKGIEAGAAIDLFPQRIPIMAEKVLRQDINNPKNHQLFFSLYINFFFGTKYDQK